MSKLHDFCCAFDCAAAISITHADQSRPLAGRQIVAGGVEWRGVGRGAAHRNPKRQQGTTTEPRSGFELRSSVWVGCMQVKTLIELLRQFNPEADVRLSVALPGRVIATREQVRVADYGGGPELAAVFDPRQFHVYVGCGMGQVLSDQRAEAAPTLNRHADRLAVDVDLGEYETEELTARVRDFFNYHRRPGRPLSDPDFDYASWIAPRTSSGAYNEHIAAILSERLLKD